jgi:catalase
VPEKKALLIENTNRNLTGVSENVRLRHAAHCYLADPTYGTALAEASELDAAKVKELAELPQIDRFAATVTR